mgnify:CR=1 FL=1
MGDVDVMFPYFVEYCIVLARSTAFLRLGSWYGCREYQRIIGDDIYLSAKGYLEFDDLSFSPFAF